jgi:transposase
MIVSAGKFSACSLISINCIVMAQLSEEERGRIVLYFIDHPGTSHQAAANALGHPRETITSVLRRFRERHVLSDAPRAGRPHALNLEQIQWLDDCIHHHRNYTSERLVTDLNQHFNLNVSSRTIRRIRIDLGYHTRKRGTYEPPTAQHRQQRIEWANNHLNINWQQYVFIDESTIVLRHTGDIEWVKRGDPRRPRILQSMRAAVQVIGAIWRNGQVFTAHNQQINGEIVHNFLSDEVYDAHPITENYTLLMDRASYHTANIVQNLLNQRNVAFEYLPPRSPDLDPVDYLWNTFKQIVKHQEPTDELSLWNAVLRAQDSMQQRAINSTIESMCHISSTP